MLAEMSGTAGTTPRQRTSSTRRRGAIALLLLLAALGFAVGCGSDPDSSSATGAPALGAVTPAVTGTVTVFAAASLTEAFTEAAEAFEDANPDADVTLSFGASSALAQQIIEGAPADVFASADEANMQKVVDVDGIDGEPVPFATNSLQIIVEPGNPRNITGVADLDASGILYVTTALEVPIGRYAAQVLQQAGVTVTPVSQEADVKGIVTKVTSGEADAGIVYVTDVTAAGADADGVTIPTDINVVATYPVGVTTETQNPEAGAAWVAFLTSAEGQAVLAQHGFGAA